jgi:hypothetical protein
MNKIALMTVEIRLVDKEKTIAIGGPPDQALAMCSRLATVMNVPHPESGVVLCLELELSQFEEFVGPLLREFTGLGCSFIDDAKPVQHINQQKEKVMRRPHNWDFSQLPDELRDDIVQVIALITAIGAEQPFHSTFSDTCAVWFIDDHLKIVLNWNEEGYQVECDWQSDKAPTDWSLEVRKAIDLAFGSAKVTNH